jgi:hypothetical protein
MNKFFRYKKCPVNIKQDGVIKSESKPVDIRPTKFYSKQNWSKVEKISKPRALAKYKVIIKKNNKTNIY